MLRILSLYLLLPLPVLAADSVEPNDDWVPYVVVAAVLLYSVIKQPAWFRKRAKRWAKKHGKYYAWVREQSTYSKALSDEDVRGIIEEAVTFRLRVQLALVSLLILGIYELYPLYAEPILGPNPPYWQELLLGGAGGAVFAAIIVFCGRISLRMRIRRLLDDSQQRTA